ncbi:MAG: diacylglycerol kinase family lipid kinase [Chloroflexi bacterium]|nr:diacylglycerol kinase family lipid kinase [Chloroflexota bacterium]
MPYAKVIVNPVAGSGKTARNWPEVMAALRHTALEFDYEITAAPGQATEIAKTAARQGYALVVSVGGDGTVNEVANGLFQAGCLDQVALGIVSMGTGGDYIRTIGIPRDFRLACKCFVSPRRVTVDLGIVEFTNGGRVMSRIFLNSAGVGLDAELTRATGRRMKHLGTKLSYLSGLLGTLFSYHNRDLWLTIDGEKEPRKVCTVLMSNGKYGGGGMLAAPDADPGDGFFDVMVVGDMSKLDLLRTLPRVYRGTHLSHPKVTIKRAREVEIHPIQPVAVQADGELLGEAPAGFKIMHRALQVVV